MAVKASVQITISKVTDIYACYRYYKLQSSTLAKPSKPTTNPPSGWSDTEPAYVSGSTNTLYFVDCNVYSDKTFSFSEVSKSSSYEAAKAAWNKAKNAQDTVDNLEIGGRNLLLNTLTMDSPWTNANKKSYKYDETNNIYYRPVWSSVNSSWTNYIAQTVTIQPNTEYTISFLAKRQSEDVNPTLMCRFDRNEAITLVIPSSGLKIDTSWKKYSFTFTTHAKSSSEPLRFYAYMGTGAYDEDTALLIANVKLEKGNKATDWTPAPEDMLPKDEAKDIYTTQLEMSKTNSELRLDFTKSITSATDDMQSQLNESNTQNTNKFTEINRYIRFVDGKIVLGEFRNELVLTIQNDRVSFTQGGNEVAYFSNNKLYIKQAEVLTTLKVGNYAFTPRNDGGLALRKRVQ